MLQNVVRRYKTELAWTWQFLKHRFLETTWSDFWVWAWILSNCPHGRLPMQVFGRGVENGWKLCPASLRERRLGPGMRMCRNGLLDTFWSLHLLLNMFWNRMLEKFWSHFRTSGWKRFNRESWTLPRTTFVFGPGYASKLVSVWTPVCVIFQTASGQFG